MKGTRGLVALAALLAVAAPSLATASDASAAVPLPTADPFYAVPANIASYPNGAILHSRSVTATTFSLPLPARAWQVEYRTTDNDGRPTATVTTILVPVIPWLGKGKRPIVSYQTAEDGVGSKCSPSYSLRAGLADATSNSTLETPIIGQALLNGWAIAVPDYEGPDSAFLGGVGEGRMVLDGVRAAQHFATAGLSTSDPVGLWGYSGGSLATSVAAQLQTSYAPELKLAGIATGGLVADIYATAKDFDATAGGALVVGIAGLERAVPSFDFNRYLSDTARADVAAARDDCITDAATQFLGVHISDLEAYPAAMLDPAVQALMRANGPDGVAGTPAEPVYDYHAVLDEFAPLTNDRAQMTRYCQAGVAVQKVEDLVAEHISEAVTGAAGAEAFLNARFNGAKPVNDCGTFPAS